MSAADWFGCVVVAIGAYIDLRYFCYPRRDR